MRGYSRGYSAARTHRDVREGRADDADVAGAAAGDTHQPAVIAGLHTTRRARLAAAPARTDFRQRASRVVPRGTPTLWTVRAVAGCVHRMRAKHKRNIESESHKALPRRAVRSHAYTSGTRCFATQLPRAERVRGCWRRCSCRTRRSQRRCGWRRRRRRRRPTHVCQGTTVGRPHAPQANAQTSPRGAHRHVRHRTGDKRDRDVAVHDGHDARTLCAPERSRSSGDRRHKKARSCTASRAIGRLAAQRTLTRLISLNSTRTSFPDTSSGPAMPKSSAVAPAAG